MTSKSEFPRQVRMLVSVAYKPVTSRPRANLARMNRHIPLEIPPFTNTHSLRSACTGSMEVALHAGLHAAIRPTEQIRPTTPASITGLPTVMP